MINEIHFYCLDTINFENCVYRKNNKMKRSLKHVNNSLSDVPSI